MICHECGTAMPDGADFCQGCGTRMGSSAAPTMLWAPPAGLGVTRIFSGEALAQTSFHGQDTQLEARKPVLGWLIVIDGKDVWKIFTVPDEDGQYIVGRDRGCDLSFDDTELEERHASIRVKAGLISITDLDTGLGTLVNGQDITRSQLQDGDTIKAGTTILKFRTL